MIQMYNAGQDQKDLKQALLDCYQTYPSSMASDSLDSVRNKHPDIDDKVMMLVLDNQSTGPSKKRRKVDNQTKNDKIEAITDFL